MNSQQIIRGGRWSRRANPELELGKVRGGKRLAKRRFEQNLAPSSSKNPYLKKKYVEEVVLSQEMASDFLLEKGLDCYFDPLENVFEVFEDQFFVLDSDRSHC